MEAKTQNKIIFFSILVSALGYFVDLYDLLLFSVVRSKSLTDLGIAKDQLLPVGLNLLNWMLAGMLLGGIIWGALGDKKGRLSVLFGSIVIYSLANILNGFIHTVESYRILRFISGVGLAGELGAGITLVSEIMSPKKRGYGTMIIALVGMLGAVLASVIGQYFEWRTAYIIGGCMGFVVLFLRIGVFESGIFKKSLEKVNIQRGNFFMLFSSWKLFSKYFKVIFVGLPVFFVIGILITGTPEFGKAFGMEEIPTAGTAVMITYACISFSDLIFSSLSQLLKSRKIPMFISLSIILFGIILFLFFPSQNLTGYYLRCALLGVGIGFWALLITNASEQFGTNLRATVTTTTPNFIRGLLIPLSAIFQLLKPNFGLVNSAAYVGIPCVLIAFVVLYFTKETFGKDLDFYDE